MRECYIVIDQDDELVSDCRGGNILTSLQACEQAILSELEEPIYEDDGKVETWADETGWTPSQYRIFKEIIR